MVEPRYLREGRLQDVLAALQLLANYPDYDLTVAQFREVIAFGPRSEDNWDKVLSAHPEFFRKSENGQDYSLVLRRAKPKSAGQRPPLSPDELSMLIDMATHLQKHELDMLRERRWLLPVLLTVIGIVATFAGTLLGAWIKGKG